MATRSCSVPDCLAPHYARGYCDAHYRRYLRYGTVDPDEPIGMPFGQEDRPYWCTCATDLPTIGVGGIFHAIARCCPVCKMPRPEDLPLP